MLPHRDMTFHTLPEQKESGDKERKCIGASAGKKHVKRDAAKKKDKKKGQGKNAGDMSAKKKEEKRKKDSNEEDEKREN